LRLHGSNPITTAQQHIQIAAGQLSRKDTAMPDSTTPPDTLGTLVRTHREARGLTQKALAHASKLSPVYISQIEKGERMPSLTVCRALAQALGCPARRLVLSAYCATAPEELQDLFSSGCATTPDDPMWQEFLPLIRAIEPLPEATRHHLLHLWHDMVTLIRGHDTPTPETPEASEGDASYASTLVY
jgi:transcriptional regulator with XRE-family HTH domain